MKSISIAPEFCYCPWRCTSKRYPCLSWRRVRGIFPSEADLIRCKPYETISEVD